MPCRRSRWILPVGKDAYNMWFIPRSCNALASYGGQLSGRHSLGRLSVHQQPGLCHLFQGVAHPLAAQARVFHPAVGQARSVEYPFSRVVHSPKLRQAPD